MVPGAGLEPAQPQWPREFKSLVSTNFTIRAIYYLQGLPEIPAKPMLLLLPYCTAGRRPETARNRDLQQRVGFIAGGEYHGNSVQQGRMSCHQAIDYSVDAKHVS